MEARNEEVFGEVQQHFRALTRGLIPAIQLSLAKACSFMHDFPAQQSEVFAAAWIDPVAIHSDPALQKDGFLAAS